MVHWLHPRKGRGKPKFRIYVTHPDEPGKLWLPTGTRTMVHWQETCVFVCQCLGMWEDFGIGELWKSKNENLALKATVL